MKQKPLKLYTHLLPELGTWEHESGFWNPETGESGETVLYMGRDELEETLRDDARIFDCRPLPPGFVEDTGRAFWEELEQTGGEVRLPFGNLCYFEFSNDYAILAAGCEESMGELVDIVDEGEETIGVKNPVGLGTTVTVTGFTTYSFQKDCDGYGEFTNGVQIDEDREPSFFTYYNTADGRDGDEMVERAGIYLLGVLTLLNQKLVTEIVEPDPKPWLTAHRAIRGKTQKSGESRILTVNVPSVRKTTLRVVSNQERGTHESPTLHWRRGHWRTLHRGSEFENQSWVRPCLVGDPSKGFIRSSYRLTHHLPMVKAASISA